MWHWKFFYFAFTNVTQCQLMRLFEGDIKTDILNSTYRSISKEHFDTKTIFISYFLSKVIDNLISNCLITKIRVGKICILYTKLLKTLRRIGLKHISHHLLIGLNLWTHGIYVKVCFKTYINFWEILTLLYIFAHKSKSNLPQRLPLAGVGSQII